MRPGQRCEVKHDRMLCFCPGRIDDVSGRGMLVWAYRLRGLPQRPTLEIDLPR